MALFSKEKSDSVVTEEHENKSGSKKDGAVKTKKAKTVLNTKNVKVAYNVLVEPWITEKTHAMMSVDKYVFKVAKNASKTEIKNAIEGIYKVKVEKMAIVNIQSKVKYFGRRKGIKSGIKKAILTLKKGDTIELFQGA